jgi:hypothetical protein
MLSSAFQPPAGSRLPVITARQSRPRRQRGFFRRTFADEPAAFLGPARVLWRVSGWCRACSNGPCLSAPSRRHGRMEEQEAAFHLRNQNGQALAYVYFEEEPGRRATAKLLTNDEAQRIAPTSPSCPSC